MKLEQALPFRRSYWFFIDCFVASILHVHQRPTPEGRKIIAKGERSEPLAILLPPSGGLSDATLFAGGAFISGSLAENATAYTA